MQCCRDVSTITALQHQEPSGFIHSWGCATIKLVKSCRDFSPSDERTQLQVLCLCFLIGTHVSGTEGMLKVFLPDCQYLFGPPRYFFPHHLIQLTTRWWSVVSSAPLFIQMPRTYSHSSYHSLIIDRHPRVSWCQMHLWTPLCSNMVLVMDEQWLAQKSNNWISLGYRLGSSFQSCPSRLCFHWPFLNTNYISLSLCTCDVQTWHVH